MEFSCNLDELDEKGLTFTEYLILFKLYNYMEYRNISINESVYELLSSKGYIKKDNEDVLGWVLTEKGEAFFDGAPELFDEFIELFPTRVTDNTGVVRVLSPASADTVQGKKLRKKWITITKNNYDKQKHIIDVLRKEVEYRSKTNKLSWMRNAETWLNNGTWEDFEFLLDEGGNTSSERSIKL